MGKMGRLENSGKKGAKPSPNEEELREALGGKLEPTVVPVTVPAAFENKNVVTADAPVARPNLGSNQPKFKGQFAARVDTILCNRDPSAIADNLRVFITDRATTRDNFTFPIAAVRLANWACSPRLGEFVENSARDVALQFSVYFYLISLRIQRSSIAFSDKAANITKLTKDHYNDITESADPSAGDFSFQQNRCFVLAAILSLSGNNPNIYYRASQTIGLITKQDPFSRTVQALIIHELTGNPAVLNAEELDPAVIEIARAPQRIRPGRPVPASGWGVFAARPQR